MAAADDSGKFRDLLRKMMTLDGRNHRRLAHDANEIGVEVPGYKPLDKHTIQNWTRRYNNSRPRDWRRLGAVLRALDTDNAMTAVMFELAGKGWDLTELQQDASPELMPLLTFRGPSLTLRPSIENSDDDAAKTDPIGIKQSSTSLSLVPHSMAIEVSPHQSTGDLIAYLQADTMNRPGFEPDSSSISGRGWLRLTAAAIAGIALGAAGSRQLGVWSEPELLTQTAEASSLEPDIAADSDTTLPPAGPTEQPQAPIISISGPAAVDCWGDNHTYEAINTGSEVTSWVWITTQLGVQTPWNDGPKGVLSFDLDPGTYSVTVEVNGGAASATKTIEVRSAEGCSGKPDQPKPSISGPGQVVCGSAVDYSVTTRTGTVETVFWDSPTLRITQPSAEGARLEFPFEPGYYTISARANNEITTTRTIAVVEGPACR